MVKQLLLTAALALSLTAAAEDSYSVVFSTPVTQVNLNNLNSDQRLATVAQGAQYLSAIPSSSSVFNNATGFQFGTMNYVASTIRFEFSEEGAVAATKIKMDAAVTANWQITVNDGTPVTLGADGVWTATQPVVLESLFVTTTYEGRTQSLQGFTVYYDGAAQKEFKPDFKTYYVCSANKMLSIPLDESHPTMTWTVEDTSVARIANGMVQGLKPGETNVTVTWPEDDNFLAGEASFRLYVVEGEVLPLEAMTISFRKSVDQVSVNAANLKEYVLEGADNIGDITQVFGLYSCDTGLKFGSTSETGYLDFKTAGPMLANFVTSVKLNFYNNKTSGATLYLNNKLAIENSTSDWDGTYTFTLPTRVSSFYLTTRYYALESIEFMYDPNINLTEEEKAVYESGLQTSATVFIDEPLQLKPAVGPAITYTSSNEAVATVSAEGVVTGIAAGEAVITASWGDKAYKAGSHQIDVTVKPARTPAMFFSTVASTAYLGVEPISPVLSVVPSTAEPYVSYASSDPEVAKINAKTGAVTIVAVGQTTITASVSADCPWKLQPASYELTVEEFVMPNNIADATDIVAAGYIENTTATSNPEKAFKPLSSLTVEGVKVDIDLFDQYDSGVTAAYEPSYQVGYEYKLFRFINAMVGNYNLQPVLTFTAPEGKKLTKITMLGIPQCVNVKDLPVQETVTFNSITGPKAYVTNISSGSVELIDNTGLPGVNRKIVWEGEGAEMVSFQLYNKVSSTYNYNIVNIAFEYEGDQVEHAPFSYTVEPADGTTVESLKTFTVSVPEGETIAITGKATVSNGIDTIELTSVNVEGNVATFTLAEALETLGEWTLTIPAGAYYYNGVPQAEEITATWTIRKAAPFSYVVFPETGSTVEHFEYVTVTVPEGETIAVTGTAVLSSDQGMCIALIDVKVEGNVATFTVPDTGIWGNVVFTLPADAYTYSGIAQSEDITSSWLVPKPVSVSELDGEALVTVYGVDGTCVLRAADAVALQTLAPGLYLVNGRKLLITK